MAEIMTKKELVGRLREREGLTWNQATRIVNEMFKDISDGVADGRDVYIPRFGRFSTATMATKKGKHPVTKERTTIPSHKIVRFHMAMEFRRKLPE